MMKPSVAFSLAAVLCLWPAKASAQSIVLTGAQLVETLTPTLGDSGEILGRTVKYTINCTLENATTESDAMLTDAANWQVLESGMALEIKQIRWRGRLPNDVKLIGDFEGKKNLTVRFLGAAPVSSQIVNMDESTVGKTEWGFGLGQAIDFNVQRLATQKALYAFDHDFRINVLEKNISNNSAGIWVRSLSFNLKSVGTFASDDQVRNGSETAIELGLNPFYFASGLIYRSEINLGYQIETRMNEAEDKLFDVLGRKLKIGAEFELPLTNYPIFKLHTKTGYARLAMPLKLSFDYLTEGSGDSETNTPARFDFKARYELAFSPYLIVQGEWHGSKFYGVPGGFDDTATYYSVAFAQDLDVVKKTLGFLKFILGPEEEIRGKNFMFFRITEGRRAPAFEDISEKSFGFGTYF